MRSSSVGTCRDWWRRRAGTRCAPSRQPAGERVRVAQALDVLDEPHPGRLHDVRRARRRRAGGCGRCPRASPRSARRACSMPPVARGGQLQQLPDLQARSPSGSLSGLTLIPRARRDAGHTPRRGRGRFGAQVTRPRSAMSNDRDIYEVPWNSDRWDLAILRRPNISFFGGPGRWVLYRPGRLIVTQARTRGPAGCALRFRAPRRPRSGDRRRDRAGARASTLFARPRIAPSRSFASINGLVRSSASLNHVQLAGPAPHRRRRRPGGRRRTRGDLPGTGSGGEGLTVLVLDTGCAVRLDVDAQRSPAATRRSPTRTTTASATPRRATGRTSAASSPATRRARRSSPRRC